MANQIRLKRASGSDPGASDLVTGEVAVRTDNGKLFTKKDDGNVVEVAGGISDGDKGDITVSNSGATFTIDSGVIDNANIASDAAISASKISGVMPTSGGSFTGNVSISDNAIEFDSDSGNTNKVSLQGPSSLSTNITLTLPNTDGNNLQGLKTDGAGNLFFGNVVKDNTEIISLYDQTSPTPIQKLLASSEGITIKSTTANVGKLMFRDRTTTNFLKFKPVDTLAAEVEFTLPSADGSANTVLKTDGSGVMSFGTIVTDSIADDAVTSAKIDDGTIVNANISSSAAIDVSKLTGVMPLSGGVFSGDVTFFTGTTNVNILFDKSASKLQFSDNVKATFGSSDDLQIFHDSSDSFIANEGTGGLVLSANALTIKNKARDENQAVFTSNSTVQLYNDNTIRLTTTGSGITVNGTATADAFSGPLTGNVTGNASGSSGSCTGNAATATALETARTIAGVSFDGTANISLNNSNITNGAGYITATLTNEQVQDIVGNMVQGNTETGITVTYQDSDGTLDFVVGTLNQDTTGNAATATALETARTIGGVSFDGTSNINLAGVNTSGNQDTSGNAATATKLATARTISGTSFDGSANITLNNSNITNGAGYITGSSLNASNLSSGTIPDGRFPATLPAISGANLTNLPSSSDSTKLPLSGGELTGDLTTHVVKPDGNNSRSLGTASLRWSDVFTNDLHLSNKGGSNKIDNSWGDFTIQEGIEDLFLINNRNGKMYKFVLKEVG